MHDFFDVLGLPDNAPVSEIRRACARRVRRAHPDFGATGSSSCGSFSALRRESPPGSSDVAIDFVDVGALLDRIQIHFFKRDR